MRKIFTGTVAILLIVLYGAIMFNLVDARNITVNQKIELNRVREEKESLQATLDFAAQIDSAVRIEYMGDFKITYYCPCEECCGQWSQPPERKGTASNAPAWEGVTIAVDPDMIPLGSYVYIQDIGYYVAQDTGSSVKGNVIDIYVSSHEKIQENGGRHIGVPVYVMR